MSDLSRLILTGSDAEIRAAVRDPKRPKVSAAVASRRLAEVLPQLGISFAEAVRALSRPAK